MATARAAERARILLALDACGISAELMGHVVSMAARLEAELHGLFVEDEALLRAASLPFAREVASTGRERMLDVSSVEAANREACAAAARLLEELAERSRVRWSFATRAGLRLRAALEAAADADVLLPPRLGRAPAAGASFGRVAFLYDASAEAERALTVVRALAANGHVREAVVVSSSLRARQAQASLAALGVRVYVQHGASGEPAELLREMGAASPGGLLIVPKRLLDAAAAGQAGALDALRSSLLLLR